MSAKKKKKRKPKKRAITKTEKGGFRVLWVALIAAGAVVAVSLLLLKPQQNEPVPQSPDRGATSSDAEVDFQKLIGRWLRPDGGYILDIRAVSSDGVMDASYLNPRTIHVAQAKATRKGNTLEVFIELRDQGYPGSTYTLNYDPNEDAFSGIYFQAALKQSFQVVFVRTN
jgi:hypothetical protein